jgi:hypothetical protein
MRRWLRRFGYDPLIRRYPRLAGPMTHFTGEPAPVAQALAQQSAEESLIQWATAYPAAALYAAIIGLAALAALITWNIHQGIDLFLFLWLLTLPLIIGNWLRKHREALGNQVRTVARRTG